MFGPLTNIAKAAASVALAPIALVADIVTLPASAMDPRAGPFDMTAATLSNAGACLIEAIEPEKS